MLCSRTRHFYFGPLRANYRFHQRKQQTESALQRWQNEFQVYASVFYQLEAGFCLIQLRCHVKNK